MTIERAAVALAKGPGSINDKAATAAAMIPTATVMTIRLPFTSSAPLVATIIRAIKVLSIPTATIPFARPAISRRLRIATTPARIPTETDIARRVAESPAVSGPASFVIIVSSAMMPVKAVRARMPFAMSSSEITEISSTTAASNPSEADMPISVALSFVRSFGPIRFVIIVRSAIIPVNAVSVRIPLVIVSYDMSEIIATTPVISPSATESFSIILPSLSMPEPVSLVIPPRRATIPTNAVIATPPLMSSSADIPEISLTTPVMIRSDAERLSIIVPIFAMLPPEAAVVIRSQRAMIPIIAITTPAKASSV